MLDHMPQKQNTTIVVEPITRYLVKYALLALYGLTASIVGVATIGVVGGSLWENTWPLLVLVFSILAAGSTVYTKFSGNPRLEVWITNALIALLLTYTVFIIIRTIVDGHIERLPFAVLPVALSVTPFAHVLDINRERVSS